MNFWEPVFRVLLTCLWVWQFSANIKVGQEMLWRGSVESSTFSWMLQGQNTQKRPLEFHAITGSWTLDLDVSSNMFYCLSYWKYWTCSNLHLYTHSLQFHPHVFYYIRYVKLYSKSLWNASFLPYSGSHSAIFSCHKFGKRAMLTSCSRNVCLQGAVI